MINPTDIALIHALQYDPLRSYWSLSEEIGISAPTVKSRFEKLLSQYPNSFNVEAIIAFEKLGLQVVDVYISLSKVKYANLVVSILERHNYIKFIGQSIGIGPHTGIFAQFVIPVSTFSLLTEFLEKFISLQYIDKYEFYPVSLQRISRPPELSAWNQTEKKWNINQKVINEGFQRINEQKISKDIVTTDFFPLHQLSSTHLIVLEELTINARRSARQIFKDRKKLLEDPASALKRSSLSLDVSLSSFQNVVHEIDPIRSTRNNQNTSLFSPGLVNRYRLNYSSQLFSIYDTCLFKGKLLNPEIGSQMINLLKTQNPFKIRMNFQLYENKEFLWYIPIPSQFFTSFRDNISKYLADDFQVMWINYGSTSNFAFWPENFDLNTKSWRIDSEYFVESPFK